MNREIKFRGITVNDTWDYGDFVHGDYESGRCYLFNNSINFLERFHEVIPKTVGQFTGLKDKNGKEIYEGDIIEYKDSTGLHRETVVFDKGCFYAGWHSGSSTREAPKLINTRISKVIGNIYESE